MSLVLRQLRAVVTSAGTAVQFSTTQLFTQSAMISADPNNIGRVWIGDSNVNASASLGAPLAANEVIQIEPTEYEGTHERIDLSNYFVDADNSTDAIIVSFYERIKDVIVIPFPNVKSLQFDGVDESVNLGNNYNMVATEAQTWTGWIKVDDFASQRCILAKATQDANVHGIGIYTQSATGKIFIQMRAPSQNTAYTTTDAITAGVWTHVAFTYSGNSNISGWTVYFNGVADSGSAPAGVVTNSMLGPEDFMFGRRNVSFPMLGNFNNFLRWNKELSSAEVAEDYNFGVPMNTDNHSAAADRDSWWKLNNDVNFPTEEDSVGSIDGTLVNMESTNYVLDVP